MKKHLYSFLALASFLFISPASINAVMINDQFINVQIDPSLPIQSFNLFEHPRLDAPLSFLLLTHLHIGTSIICSSPYSGE